MKLFLLIVAPLLVWAEPLLQQQLLVEDIQVLTGDKWVGSLTYRDYRSNKMVSIPSTLSVSRTADKEPTFELDFQYPEEPKANGKKTVVIKDYGRKLDDEKVVERRQLTNDLLKVVTEKKGKDNDRDALMRFTYLISAKSFSITKEVKYEGSSDYVARNQYNWAR